jgi:transcriptional regulator GlxA family with amidase domain
MEQRVLLVISLMKVNPGSEPSIEKLASAVGLSLSRLRHLFKAEAGMSPAQYYRTLRMRKAKQLIETTFLSMKEIRARVGISSKDQFTRDFKRLYGRTPAQHRAHRLIVPIPQIETDYPGKLTYVSRGLTQLPADARPAPYPELV